MREIKFRVWSTIQEPKMIYLKEGMLSDLQSIQNKWMVQQFTGLKDKNGKEIYEGDIIGYPNKQIRSIVKFGEYNFQGDEYGLLGNGFYLQKHNEEQQSSIYDYPKNTDEVIGNIFENPELIK